MSPLPPVGPRPLVRRVRTASLALLLGTALVAPTLPSAAAEPVVGAPSGTVTHWNAVAGEAALAVGLAPANNPLHESRMYAMVQVAVHDTLNAIEPRYRSYAYDGDAPAGTSVEAAVAVAAHDVLVSALGQLTPPFDAGAGAGVAVVEDAFDDAMAAVPEGRARTDGVAVGAAAADAVLALRAGDGSDTPLFVGERDFEQGTEPGEWRFTPERPFAFAPGWGDVDPFALGRASQFGIGAPYRVTGRRYAADLAEVKALGGDDVTTPSARTADQTEIAYFWLESSPLAWNRIARTLAAEQGLDEWEAARLLALLDLALADGYVASFDTKYDDSFWRPVTAIRAAARDGNPATTADPDWTPLAVTPPIPDHDSAHAVEGGAAAAVFRSFFGTDAVAFSACSRLLPEGTCTEADPTLRTFDSFSAAAQENADSRIYVGFHFRHATEAGLDHGHKIGSFVAHRYLKPLRGRRS